ncbi:cGMP-dependent 3',5'-cyclic phosphodiesterase [Batrachochytrium dendrobatidis]
MHSRKSDYTVASGTTLEFFDGIHKSNRNLSVFPFKADPSSDIAFSRQTTQPLPSKLKSLTTPTLPKLGTGPLHLQFAHSVTASLPSNSAAASADTGSTAFTSHDTPHGFFNIPGPCFPT